MVKIKQSASKPFPLKQKVILIISGLLLCMVLLEVGLRIGGCVSLFLQEYRNRISIGQKGVYRIMCLGESTTAFGGRYSYPRQLEEILNRRSMGMKFSVINKGIPAMNSTAIILQLQYNLDKYNPDMVIAMMGINDEVGNYIATVYADPPAERPSSYERLISYLVSFRTFRTYKLAKLIRQRIINKVRKIESSKLKGRIIDLIQPSYFKEREKAFKKTIEINPKNDNAYIELGRWYQRHVKLDQAEEMFKKAIEINLKNDNAYKGCVKLGQLYWKRKRFAKAEEMFKKAVEINPKNDRAYRFLAIYYKDRQKHKLAEECFKKANLLRLEYYSPILRDNYHKLKEIVDNRRIRLVCVQYPVRDVVLLKGLFKDKEGIIFVDNEMVFKDALRQASHGKYFTDLCGGDFGHCTPRGNRLLAENIANVILKECFNRQAE